MKISLSFLIGLVIGLILVFSIFGISCSLVPLVLERADEMIDNLDTSINLLEEGLRSTSPVIVLTDRAFFYYIEPNKDYVSFKRGNSETRIIRDINCHDRQQGCFCYCDRVSGRAGGVITCRPQLIVCESFEQTFEFETQGIKFFGDDASSNMEFENGFILWRDLRYGFTLPYRRALTLQKLSNGNIAICSKQGLCNPQDLIATGVNLDENEI